MEELEAELARIQAALAEAEELLRRRSHRPACRRQPPGRGDRREGRRPRLRDHGARAVRTGRPGPSHCLTADATRLVCAENLVSLDDLLARYLQPQTA